MLNFSFGPICIAYKLQQIRPVIQDLSVKQIHHYLFKDKLVRVQMKSHFEGKNLGSRKILRQKYILFEFCLYKYEFETKFANFEPNSQFYFPYLINLLKNIKFKIKINLKIIETKF